MKLLTIIGFILIASVLGQNRNGIFRSSDFDESLLDLLTNNNLFMNTDGDEQKECKPDLIKVCDDKKGVCKVSILEDEEDKCNCKSGSEFNQNEICQETCTSGADCKNGGECKSQGGFSFCTCAQGLDGDKCEIVQDCEVGGKYEKCKTTGGTCDFSGTEAACNCPPETAFDSTSKGCKECKCGVESTACTFAEEDKHCTCNDGFAQKGDTCIETCKDNADCHYGMPCEGDEDVKFCKCDDGLSGDKCQTVDLCLTDLKKCNEGKGNCTFESGKANCTCSAGKEFDVSKETCRDTCKDNADCHYGMLCEGDADVKFCKCEDGLSGDKCQTVDLCLTDLRKCNEGKGNCTFESGKANCTCGTGKEFDISKETCRDTCKNNADCHYGMLCEGDADVKFCKCVDGLSGDKCQSVDLCLTDLKKCNEENGNCTFESGKAICTCSAGKKFDVSKETCRDTCKDNAACHYGMLCEGDADVKFCKCVEGLSGDKCQTVDLCLTDLKNCKLKNGNCTFVNGAAICNCPTGKMFDDTSKICKETCTSDPDCHFGSLCKADGEKQFCQCLTGLSGDMCQIVDLCQTDLKNCKGEEGNCTFEKEAAICKCKTGKMFDDSANICKDCRCGEGEKSCSFKSGKMKCECEDDFVERSLGGIIRCVATCDPDGTDDCKNEGNCTVKLNDKHVCKCPTGTEGDKCEIVSACKAGGSHENCKKSGGVCSFSKGSVTCTCPDPGKEFETKSGKCRATCTTNEDGSSDCMHGGKCVGMGDHFFCQCGLSTSGDKCEIIQACEKGGKFENCRQTQGTCTFGPEGANCECLSGMALDKAHKGCRKKCSSKDDCQNGAPCSDGLCQCRDGTEGDDCSIVPKCDAVLQKKCVDAKAQCKYIIDKGAGCVCDNKNLIYNNGECISEWCRSGPCKKDVSTCKFENETSYCECNAVEDKTVKLYYDYSGNTCKALNKCLLRKKLCAKNEMCVEATGECECAKGFKLDTTTKICKPEFCDKAKTKCFPGSDCQESSLPGVIKCVCNKENKFFDGRKCADISCILQLETCKAACPTGMKKKEGSCVHDKPEDTKCEKDCGYGYCVKIGGKDNCICYDKMLTKLSGDKCILVASSVCTTGLLLENGKCNCTGFKTAANEITCEAKTCADADVQATCKNQGAFCQDQWSGKIGYKCVCPDGYAFNQQGKCVDGCSLEENRKCQKNTMCILKHTPTKTEAKCECIPGFSIDNGECKPSTKHNGFIIKNMVVKSTKYQMHDSISVPTLNADINAAMKLIYPQLDFAYLLNFNYRKTDDISCDVWLQLKEAITPTERNRWIYQLTDNFLPPGLKLKEGQQAVAEDLDICSPTVQMKQCGAGSTCKSNECSCKTGYQVVDGSYQKIGAVTILRCEDVDECAKGTDECPPKTKCINTNGDYKCDCESGYKKIKSTEDDSKLGCTDLCTPSPCGQGSCTINKQNEVECSCKAGYAGAFCNRADANFASAKKSTAVVGAILGTLLGVLVLLILFYAIRQKKNSYSEDFTSSPRMDNAEMVDRRPMRGVTNRAYQ